MEQVDLLLIEYQLQSTSIDSYITMFSNNLLKDITIMPDMQLLKRNENLQIYKHSHSAGPVIQIFGANKDGHSSLVHVHQFYPFGFIALPVEGETAEYVINDPPSSATFSSAQHSDPSLVIPNSSELKFMLNVYNQITNYRIPVIYLSLHQYKSIYGFNPMQKYIKVTYLDPFHRFKLWNLLANGKILNIKFQCFHFHFDYTDVFMREFDLQGCQSVIFKSVKYRRNKSILDKDWLSLINAVPLGTLAIEFDTIVTEVSPIISNFDSSQPTNPNDDLLNKSFISRKWNIPTVKPLWQDEYNRRSKYHINSKTSQESTRSVDVHVKSGVFDNNRSVLDLTTWDNPDKYPEWEKSFRLTIDKLILEIPQKECVIQQNYKFNFVVPNDVPVFQLLIEYLGKFKDGYRESSSSQILTNATVEEDQILDLMVDQMDVGSVQSESSADYLINNTLQSDLESSEDEDHIILQVDGQDDKKDKKHKFIEVVVPKKRRRGPSITFKPLNVITTPPKKKERLFEGATTNLWSPVKSPTKVNKQPEQLSNLLTTPSRQQLTRASSPFLSSFSDLPSSFVYFKPPPLFSLPFQSYNNNIISLKNTQTWSKWVYIKQPPIFKPLKPISNPLPTSSIINLECIQFKILCVEILAHSNKHYYNPINDKITAIAYSLQNNWHTYSETSEVLVDDDEYSLIFKFIDLIKTFEPDIILGWDIHNGSVGYIIKRCEIHKIDLLAVISRLSKQKQSSKWQETHTSAITTSGRLFLNAWRICRNNLDLRLYTFENTYYSLFNESYPMLEVQELNFTSHFNKLFALRYLRNKCAAVLQILDKIDFMCQTIEFSRLYGIPFESVLTRGSQYRVESVLYKICKNQRMLMASPTKADVNKQQAAEFIPLVMEPNSQFYDQPVSVVDFQSLYPSLMIAYNYCFSTVICKINKDKVSDQLGCFKKSFDLTLLQGFYNYLSIAPNGAIFINSKVKKGVLTMLVVDLLDTRVMIKESMKLYKNKHLLKLLNARQLALKLLANVIYGYASASFSGRMPMVEVADAIVSMGRFTLKATKDHIEGNYPVAVRYGDTDSLFIECMHFSKQGALQLNNRIINDISRLNPHPMKLKFEKLYLKCFLLTKKRYCGYKIEYLEDTPTFEAKGIETVRRDGCYLTSHLLREALIKYFKDQNIEHFKAHLFEMFNKIQSYPLRYFIIAKEVRVGSYKMLPPGAVVAQRQMDNEPGFESQYGYRQPYLVIYNADKLKENVVSPREYLNHKDWILNYQYYVEKQLVPVFERIFQFTPIKMTEIQSQLYKRNVNVRYNIVENRYTHHQLHSICQACLKMSPMHGKPMKCMTYICDMFDEKLKLNGEWF